jgi:hypothetical protein
MDFLLGGLLGVVLTLDCVAFRHCRHHSWWGVLPLGGFYFWFKERA